MIKINLQNYTKDRCEWMLFEFDNKQIGIAWDNTKFEYRSQLIFMNHPIKQAKLTRRDLNIVIRYL